MWRKNKGSIKGAEKDNKEEETEFSVGLED